MTAELQHVVIAATLVGRLTRGHSVHSSAGQYDNAWKLYVPMDVPAWKAHFRDCYGDYYVFCADEAELEAALRDDVATWWELTKRRFDRGVFSHE